jgi:hypothetical protein
MLKTLRFVILPLLTLGLIAGFALCALQPSWWTRQIVFSRHDSHSSSVTVFTAPDLWFSLYVLFVVSCLVVYFAVTYGGRLLAGRGFRDSRPTDDHEQHRKHI